MKYYYTYEIKIVNKDSNLNECYHYGKHETDDLNDNYFGSGVILRNYINKYGTQHLVKTILSFYTNREQLNQAEKELIDIKREQLGDKCLNRHEGGTGGHWIEYCSEEEYKWRVNRVREGLARNTTPEWRSNNARRAGLSKRNVPEERKKQWSQNYKNAYVNMSAEDKHLKYKKVSDSLKKFYANNSNDEKIRLMREHNKASNIATAKIWRTEFFQLFKRTPESFRSCGKMKDAIQLYRRLKNTSKEQQEYEISRFMESIGV